MGIPQTLPLLKTLARVATEPAQTRLGIGGQALAVDLPTPEVTRQKMIGAAGFFDITLASAEQAHSAQEGQNTEQTVKSSHAGILLVVSYRIGSHCRLSRHGYCFSDTNGKSWPTGRISAEISGIVEFQPFLQDI
jgi:hypothetical protein